MTNNPTIDGVSPKRGDRLFHVGNTRSCPRGWVEFLCFDGCGEATVRTKNGAVPSVQVEHLQWHAMTDEQQLQEFYSELSNGGKLSKRALCHIRDQQSTIARLEARVAELESGRGEAVCYQARHSAEEPWFFTDKPGYWEWRPLFTAPPAPVVVVMPERMPGPVDTDSHEEGWNACLDATAALNGPDK